MTGGRSRPLAWRMARVAPATGRVRRAPAASSTGSSPRETPPTTPSWSRTGARPLLRRRSTAQLEAAMRRPRPWRTDQDDPTARSVAHMAAAYTLSERDQVAARGALPPGARGGRETGDIVQVVRLRNADDETPLAEQYAAATDSLALIEAGGNPVWFALTLLNRGILAARSRAARGGGGRPGTSPRVASTTAPRQSSPPSAFLRGACADARRDGPGHAGLPTGHRGGRRRRVTRTLELRPGRTGTAARATPTPTGRVGRSRGR